MERIFVSQKLYLYPIEILDVPHRAMVRLKSLGVFRLEQLAGLTESDLLSVYHFGQKSLFELKRRLDILNQCVMEEGRPPEDIIECMRLKLEGPDEFLEEVISSFQEEDNGRTSICFYLAKLPPRGIFVVSERIGLRRAHIRTLQEIADVMSLTRERVRQLQNRSLQYLQSSLCEEDILSDWEETLVWAATTPPPGEQSFLERVESTGVSGNANTTGFVVLATHIIKGIELPPLLRAVSDGKLNKIWARKRQIKDREE
jgi:hypothetical protein